MTRDINDSTKIQAMDAALADHVSDGNNPHNTNRDHVGLSEGDAPQFAGIELGHATDTTLARAAPGRATIEGAEVVRSSTAQGGTGATVIQNLVRISQADFDALDPPDAGTLYVVLPDA